MQIDRPCRKLLTAQDTSIFPLLETKFENVTAKIPFKYRDLLVEEYGQKALTDKRSKK